MNRSPVRSPLGKWAAVSQDAPTLSEAERRRLLREAWVEYGLPAFQPGDVNDLLWRLLEREATRLYGERRT